MLKEFFDALVKHAENRVDTFTVHRGPDHETRQVLVDGVKTGAPFDVPRMPPKKSHIFDTLEGFISYLNSDHCDYTDEEPVHLHEDPHIVFVGGEYVTANMSYSSNQVHCAALSLFIAEEFEALMRLREGVTQKELWRALVTDLAQAFPLQLRLAISNLDLKASEERQVEVLDTGLEEESGRRVAKLTYPSLKTGETDTEKTLALDWTYTGRFRECYSLEITVPIRIEVKIERGSPMFYFHCIGLPTIMRKYRQHLAAHIVNELNGDRYTVHEGTEVPSETSPPASKGFSY